MRILHTADWHFGKTLEGRDRMPEQRQFVAELIALCAQEQIDLVLVAGDVYQTVNPSAQAEELFYAALDGLSAGGTRGVVVIAGNHDNADRIAAARPLADKLGITLMGLPKDVLTPTLAAGGVHRVAAGLGWLELAVPGCAERALVAAVPYPSESRLNEVLTESLDEMELQVHYNARLAGLFQELAVHYRADTVNLALSHVYVQGGLESESEVQIQVGGAYAVHPGVFPATAQYVALGHLHRPQGVQGAAVPMRYAGSPLAYSFSEAGQQKSVVVLDVAPGQPAVWREIPLCSGKPLVRWTATEGVGQVLQWVQEGRDANAWIDLSVHVHSGLQLEEIHRLRDVFAGFVHIRPVLPEASGESNPVAQQRLEELPLDQVFTRFYQERQGVPPDVELIRLFLELASDVEDRDIAQVAAGIGEGVEV
ncbi:exonuclease SbcCD subunit D [Alicyclobacillaceae bacterium I2511]|nr:exonuclease SbcCD subunit D [Alicyclobacillaceae bacterium I2511]